MPLPDLTVTPQLTLKVERCHDCGRYYGVELARLSRCPYCAAGDVERAVEHQVAAERSAAATRGALAKAKKLVAAYRADAADRRKQ
jgi:hypothetical protein